MPLPSARASGAVSGEAISVERFFDLSVNMLCVAGLDGMFRRVSPEFTVVLGWSVEELCSRPFLSFVHPDDVDATLGEMARLSTGATTIAFENRYSCSDGSWKVLRWDAAPDVTTGLLYASAQDVTAQHEAEHALAAAKRRIENILTVAGEGIAEFDARGVLTFANPAACQIWGQPVEALIGRRSDEIARQLDADGTPVMLEQAPLFRVLRDGVPVETSTRIRRRDGRSLMIDVTVSPVIAANGTRAGAVAVLRDATDRLRAQAELARRTEALGRSNEELQQFAYVASHDLQEPLRKIASFLQIIETDYADRLDEDGREYIQFAVDGAHRMRQLIEDLLTISRVRVETMEMTVCDAAAILDEVLTDLAVPLAEAGATIEAGSLPSVPGDAMQLRRVFQNLVSNAIKYRSIEPPVVRVSAEQTADGWLFAVADNGIGFKQEYAEKVFGMFQRLVSRHQAPGTGIGLAIVQKAVTNHGGRIWVESEPGVGTTFRFTLPGSPAGTSARVERKAA